MKEIYLNCLLMDNNEILFLGKSVGFLTEQQKKKFIKKPNDFKDEQLKKKIPSDEKYTLTSKRNLYHTLLKKDKSNVGLTDNEIEIMYLLSLDKEIQDFLQQ